MKYSRNSLLLTGGLSAIAAAIVFHAWWPTYAAEKERERQALEDKARAEARFSTLTRILKECAEVADEAGVTTQTEGLRQEVIAWCMEAKDGTYPP